MASIKRIDHVAIAVRDVAQATEQYIKLLNAVHIRTETLREKAGMVKVAYMQIGENVLSLVQSLEEDGFINQHIAKHVSSLILVLGQEQHGTQHFYRLSLELHSRMRHVGGRTLRGGSRHRAPRDAALLIPTSFILRVVAGQWARQPSRLYQLQPFAFSTLGVLPRDSMHNSVLHFVVSLDHRQQTLEPTS